MRISIIGAGPAGTMAAVRLARAGASVSLFDPTHPREKPCGGGLTGRALSLLSDVIDVGSLPAVVVTSATVEPPSSRASGHETADVPLIDKGLTPGSSLVVVSRAIFDRALVLAAVASGARLLPEKVIGIARRGPTMVVRTDGGEYEADHVLGADGTNSLVRRILAAPFTRQQLSTAAGFFVPGVRSSVITVKSMRDYPGYLWSFPRPDHLAVGVCAPASHRVSAPMLAAQARTWVERHAPDRAHAVVAYAWPIPSAGFADARQMMCAGDGWMLLGDAAGLVDPLTREGIFYALLSGAWAAESLASAPSARAAARYADRLRAVVQPELARAARLGGLFFSPAFSRLFVDALRGSERIRKVFVDLVGGTQPYRGLRRRLLSTGEWKLAAKAIRSTMETVVSPQEM